MAKKPDRSMPAYRTAVLVLGMHRSGTSAIARIVNFLGAAMPRHLVPASQSNPRGHWESSVLVGLHEQLLAELDSSWDDWRAPGSRWKDGDIATSYASRIRAAIDEEYGTAPLLVLKDPRMSRTLPYWMSVLEKSGIRSAPLIMVRNPLEVAESLRERDGISFEKAMLLWLRHYLDAEHETRHLPRNVVTLDALLEDWKLLAVQTGGRLGIQWPRQPNDAASDVREFLDIELHNHRATMAELEAHTEVPGWVKTAYRALTQLCDEPKSAEPKRELDKVRAAFAESSRVFGVVAFAQTEAVKQAAKDVTEANIRADAADALRAELAKARESNNTMAARVRTLEVDLNAAQARAGEFERIGQELETALAHTKGEAAETANTASLLQARAEEAERRIAAFAKTEDMLKKAVNDAKELQALAKRLSDRTETLEGHMKAQQKKSDKAHAEAEEIRAKSLGMAAELKAALQNAVALQKELAAAKDQIHTAETKAVRAAAEARHHQQALAAAEDRIAELESDERNFLNETSELRAELAQAWAKAGKHQPLPAVPHVATSEPVAATDARADQKVARLAEDPRGRRVEEDLRFERMHVQHLERRLNTWSGLASAALRKITRLGRKPAARRKPPTKRLAGPAPAE